MNIEREQSGTQYSASSESLNTKAFKGKGVRWKMRQVQSKMENIQDAMRLLSELSQDVVGREILLQYCVDSGLGREQIRLRWRKRSENRYVYITDRAAQEIFMAYGDATLRDFYCNMAQQASLLNGQHTECMRQMR